MSERVKEAVGAPDAKLVRLTVDNTEISVPEGTLVVDAAKRAGIDIPVFCYHPKMEPVGMCRMCLVEIGRVMPDRQTGERTLQFGPKLETGCTIKVEEGMVVRGYTENVQAARKDVVEFLLTSHPLDCPICDKGGECPLQNLTMAHGPGTSRYIYEEKKQLDKHVPLGDLIFLDRERCIQCARCTRFQSEVVDDAVIGFSQRGRSLEIVTFSEPGFDSYWSGNTTDICPVGALTTADFRFGARPWELNASASVCNHCPVGCNITFNTRREAKAGGEVVIKRVMPRQNEAVNEIWMCDKGRFAYHYTEHKNRLTQPLVRKDGELAPATWEEALDLVAKNFKKAGKDLVTLAGGKLSNEDYFNLSQLAAHLGGKALLDSQMAGGEMVAQVGVGAGANFSDLGSGDAILVVASDLEEEAPLWWLRVKQAAERGAALIVANPRGTKTDANAGHILRYDYGQEAAFVLALATSNSPKRPDLSDAVKELLRMPGLKEAGEAFATANNAIVLYGSEGTSLAASKTLAEACANLLISTGHVGKKNNGLIAVWDKGNAQGAWDMGLQPGEDLAADLQGASAVYLVGADPAGDDEAFTKLLEDETRFVVAQELQMTRTAELADVVLPAQAFTEREGSYTSGERRVQRFYPAVPEPPGAPPDFGITGRIAERLGLELETRIASRAFLRLAETHKAYAGLTYQKLAEVTEQWPIIGRDDVYYGGTTYDNSQGLGVQLTSAAERGEIVPLTFAQVAAAEKPKGLLAVPVTRLYDQGTTVTPSEVLAPRLSRPHVVLHPDDADKLKIEWNSMVKVKLNGTTKTVTADFDNSLPPGVVLVPRSLGMPIYGPMPVTIQATGKS
jgi:NADH-quinone oxidoreductase subunit G